MTFFYFLNCIALSVIPHVLVYKTTILAEYDTFYKALIAGVAYIATQTVKLLIEATFFPASDVPPNVLDYVGELLAASTILADLIGLHVAITQTPGRGTIRWLTAGLGWSAAHLACTKTFSLWQARGLEFDWKFLQMAITANAELITFISLAALLWLRTRTPRLKLVTLLAFLACFKHFVIKLVVHMFFNYSSSHLIMGEIIWSLLFALLTARLYIIQGQMAAMNVGYGYSGIPEGYDTIAR